MMQSSQPIFRCLTVLLENFFLSQIIFASRDATRSSHYVVIQESISYSKLVRSFNPFTVRLIIFNNTLLDNTVVRLSEELEMATETHPKIISSSVNFLTSLEPDRRRKRTIQDGALMLQSFFTIVYHPWSKESNTTLLNKDVEKGVNPRLDFLLLVLVNLGDSDEDMGNDSYVMKHFPVLSRILHKIIFTLSQSYETLWMEPLVFTKPGKLHPLSGVPNAPSKNLRMGYNLAGRHFQAVISQSPPMSYEVNKTFKGYYVNLFHESSLRFNFTYNLVNDGFGYGTLHPNGTWSGKYARIFYPNTGTEVALFLSNHVLMARGDRSPPISVVDSGFVMGVPLREDVPWYVIFQPFRGVVWLWSAISFAILGTFLGGTVYIFDNARHGLIFIMGGEMWSVLSAVLDQGMVVKRYVKGYIGILLFATLVLGTAYKSKLRSYLMFPKADRFPLTLEELAEMPEYKITLLITGKIEYAFYLESDLTLMRKLRPRLKIERNWLECLKIAFFEEKHVCIIWSIGKAMIAQSLTLNTTIPSFLYSKESVLQLFSGVAFQENSIFSTAFDLIVSSIYEVGLIDKWERDLMREMKSLSRQQLLSGGDSSIVNIDKSALLGKLLKIAEVVKDMSPLTLRSLWGVWLLFAVGIVIGSMTWCLEVVRIVSTK